jgi:hypothetical protein
MVRRRRWLVAWIVLVVLSLPACQYITQPGIGFGNVVRGSGRQVQEERAVSDFRGVELATIGTLHIEVGEPESLRIEAEDNLLPYIQTTVRGETLVIEVQSGTSLRPTRPVNYVLTVDNLDSIALSSSGDAEAPDLESKLFTVQVSSSGGLQMGDLACDTFRATVSSSGDVSVGQVNGQRLEAELSSSGDLTVAGGTVDRQEIRISSSGNYSAQNLQSQQADVQLSSSGSATIRVAEQLTARLSSSGNVRYAGNPRTDVTTTSSGNVIHISE